jgi:pimeloyl-ACP methyl ester carboxylesterase
MGIKLLIIAITLFTTSAFAGYKEIYERRFEAAQAQRFLKIHGVEAPPLIFSQRINPDDVQDQRTYLERYWVSSTYATTPNAPVLLFLCGEWTCGTRDLSRLVPLAQKLHAHMVAMEHRYYGESQPFTQLTTENLKYLSTRLALADFATLQKHLQATHGLTGKWFVVGGSYSGSLAAYYRLKYPSLVEGAWASSGPVKAKENFEEYDLHVATVAGSACAAAMRTVVKQAEQALTNATTSAQMKTLFQAQTLTNDDDFLYLVADMGALAIQYGYRDHFCDLLAGPDALKGYTQFVSEIFLSWQMNALSGSFAGATSLNPDDYQDSATRQWYYQSCTEYGYWQNSYHDQAITVRSTRINPAYHANGCQRLFGKPLSPQIESMNNEFYLPLLDPKQSSQVVFNNGSRDPWSKLSISKENGNASNLNHVTFTIDGASHCDDLHAESFGDSPALIQARQLVYEKAKAWLGITE